MLSLTSMFGRSPFALLIKHMDKVTECVEKVPKLILAIDDPKEMSELVEEVSTLEHQADLAKNDIRNHLPRTLFLPIDRAWLLEIIDLQDQIANLTEDLAVVLQIRSLTFDPSLKKIFMPFLDKNLEAFYQMRNIHLELNELLETSFGGIEAEKVRAMVEVVAKKEHEVDLLQRDVIIQLYALEEKMTYATFDLWKKVIELLSSISDISETIANRIRMVLDLK